MSRINSKRTGSTGSSGGLVYSTQHGTMCPACNAPLSDCQCNVAPSSSASRDGIVRVGRETQGRKGAGVTVVIGAPLDRNELSELCTQLKKRCGSGGTLKDSVIEIQGDHRDVIVAELAKRGWIVKRVGG